MTQNVLEDEIKLFFEISEKYDHLDYFSNEACKNKVNQQKFKTNLIR